MGRVLGYTVPVHDVPGKPMGVSYPAGTAEEDIPEEHLAQITNPKAWTSPDLSHGTVEGIDVDDQGDEFPEHLEDCTNRQLLAIAERGIDGEPIELGKLRRNADIIEVLRQYGIDPEGAEAGGQ